MTKTTQLDHFWPSIPLRKAILIILAVAAVLALGTRLR